MTAGCLPFNTISFLNYSKGTNQDGSIISGNSLGSSRFLWSCRDCRIAIRSVVLFGLPSIQPVISMRNVTFCEQTLSPWQAVLSSGGLCSKLDHITHRASATAREHGRLLGETGCGGWGLAWCSGVTRELRGGWEHVEAYQRAGDSGVKVPSSPATADEWIWGNSYEYSIECYRSLSTFFSPLSLTFKCSLSSLIFHLLILSSTVSGHWVLYHKK